MSRVLDAARVVLVEDGQEMLQLGDLIREAVAQ